MGLDVDNLLALFETRAREVFAYELLARELRIVKSVFVSIICIFGISSSALAQAKCRHHDPNPRTGTAPTTRPHSPTASIRQSREVFTAFASCANLNGLLSRTLSEPRNPFCFAASVG